MADEIIEREHIIKGTVYMYRTTIKNGVGSSVIVGSRPQTDDDVPSAREIEIVEMFKKGTWTIVKGTHIWTPNP